MSVYYDENDQTLHVEANSQCELSDMMRILGYRKLHGVFLSGSSHATFNSLKDIDLEYPFCITARGQSSLIVNVFPDVTLPKVVVSTTGAASVTIINPIIKAAFCVLGVSKCIVTQPLQSCRVESLSAVATLQIAGESITTTIRRTLKRMPSGEMTYVDERVNKLEYSSSISSSDESASDSPVVAVKSGSRPTRTAAILQTPIRTHRPPKKTIVSTKVNPRLPNVALAQNKTKARSNPRSPKTRRD